jgi:hypothetical protein
MPKPHNRGKNWNNRNGFAKKQNGTSRQNATKTKAILMLKPTRKPEQTIKANFMDQNDNEVKELVYTFDDDNSKDSMIFIIVQLFQLAKSYDLWKDEDWKILSYLRKSYQICRIGLLI